MQSGEGRPGLQNFWEGDEVSIMLHDSIPESFQLGALRNAMLVKHMFSQ